MPNDDDYGHFVHSDQELSVDELMLSAAAKTARIAIARSAKVDPDSLTRVYLMAVGSIEPMPIVFEYNSTTEDAKHFHLRTLSDFFEAIGSVGQAAGIGVDIVPVPRRGQG